jgi:hypothetical protein
MHHLFETQEFEQGYSCPYVGRYNTYFALKLKDI